MAKAELPNEVAVGRRDISVSGHHGGRQTVMLWVRGTSLVLDHGHARELGRTLIQQADLVDVEQEDEEWLRVCSTGVWGLAGSLIGGARFGGLFASAGSGPDFDTPRRSRALLGAQTPAQVVPLGENGSGLAT